MSENLRCYGQYKYSIMRKSTRQEWRILDYLECMRDWSDPSDSKYYGEAISNYVTILNKDILEASSGSLDNMGGY